MANAMAASDAEAQMNVLYRRQRHIYDLTRKYFLLGRDRALARLGPPPQARILEIGCGTGRNLIVMARRYPSARIYGLDLSREMLATASARLARSCLARRVQIAKADATDFDPQVLFSIGQFDRVVVSYTLSMVPAWPAVLDRALGVLAPGGELHVVDFGGQEKLPSAFRRLLRHWLALFSVVPRDTLEAELRRRAVNLGAELVVERPYRDYAQHAVVRRPRLAPPVASAA